MLHYLHSIKEFCFFFAVFGASAQHTRNLGCSTLTEQILMRKNLKTSPRKFDLLVHLLSPGVDSGFTSSSGGLAWPRLRRRWLNLLTAICGSQSTCNPGNPGCPVLSKLVIGNSSCSGPQPATALMDFILTFLFYGRAIFKIPNSTRSLMRRVEVYRGISCIIGSRACQSPHCVLFGTYPTPKTTPPAPVPAGLDFSPTYLSAASAYCLHCDFWKTQKELYYAPVMFFPGGAGS